MTANFWKLLEPKSRPICREREEELKIARRLLNRLEHHHVAVIGPPGVGKTTLLQAISQRLKTDWPELKFLRPVVILAENLSFDLSEGKEEEIAAEAAYLARGRPLAIFLDDLETALVEPEPSRRLGRVLSPFLRHPNHRLIFSIAPQAWREKLEKDSGLAKFFEPLFLEEPTLKKVLAMTAAHQERLENLSNQTIAPQVIEETITLAKRYLGGLSLPQAAITLLDESLAEGRVRGNRTLTLAQVREVIAEKTGIPLKTLTQGEKEKLRHLDKTLKQTVIGQDAAIDRVTKVIRRARVGLRDPLRPIGCFLFLGPSGVGKTELAKVIAKTIFETEKALVRLDMSEFSESHTVQRLVGAPPGYIGFEEGGQLTNPIKARPYSLILLDELEKAHPKVFDLFLQVTEDGRLTDGQGQTVDFRNTIIIATSNVASEEILALGENPHETKLKEIVFPMLADYFRPEFLNRFDEIIVFRPLDLEALGQIAQMLITSLEKRLGRPIPNKPSPEAMLSLIKPVFDPALGARPIRRLIAEQFEDRLVEAILNEEEKTEQSITWQYLKT